VVVNSVSSSTNQANSLLDLDLLGSNLYNGYDYNFHEYQDQSDWTDLCTSLSSDQYTTSEFSTAFAQSDNWTKVQPVDDFQSMTGHTFNDFLSYDIQASQLSGPHTSQSIPALDNTTQPISENESSIFFNTFELAPSPPTNAHSHSQSPSLSTTPPSSTASSSSPKDHSSTPKSSLSHANPDKIKKRTLNTVAARRYRQKKVDQVVGLEAALQESEAEKDELRLRVARLEAEVDVLRGLVRK